MKRLHDGTETADYRVHHHHDCRRRMTSIATPLGEGGRKAERGIGSPVPTSNCRSQRPVPEASPEAQRRATCHGTTTSSRISRLPGDTNRPNSAAVMANGGVGNHPERMPGQPKFGGIRSGWLPTPPFAITAALLG